MIATFGIDSGGIIEGIRKFESEKLILFLSKTPQAKESVDELKKIIKSGGKGAELTEEIKEALEEVKRNQKWVKLQATRILIKKL